VDGQTLLAILAVAAALAYLARRTWRTWAARAGCGGGCGCAERARPPAGQGAGALIPADQITLRTREAGGLHRPGSGQHP
jgi:hypothetical protein